MLASPQSAIIVQPGCLLSASSAMETKTQLSCSLFSADITSELFFATFGTFGVYLTSPPHTPSSILMLRPRTFIPSFVRPFCHTRALLMAKRGVDLHSRSVSSGVPAWACLCVCLAACLSAGRKEAAENEDVNKSNS